MRAVLSSSVQAQGPSGDDDYLAREARARRGIDKQLAAAGWMVQAQEALNLRAGPGVAVREFTLEIVEDLQAALEQFAAIASSLGTAGTGPS